MLRKTFWAATLVLALAPAFASAQNADASLSVPDASPPMHAGAAAENERYQDIIRTESSVLKVMKMYSAQTAKLAKTVEHLNDLRLDYLDAMKGHDQAAAHKAEVEYTGQVKAVYAIGRPLQRILETQDREIRRLELNKDDVYLLQRRGGQNIDSAMSDAYNNMAAQLELAAINVGRTAPELAVDIDPAMATASTVKPLLSDADRRNFLTSELPKRVHEMLIKQGNEQSQADSTRPGAAASAAMQKAAGKATLWVPSNGAVVHFKHAVGRVNFGKFVSGTETLKDERTSSIDWVIPNTGKVRNSHSPDAVLIVSTSGSLTGQIEMLDVIAVRYRHGEIAFLAQYPLDSRVLGVPVSKVELVGNTIKVTYLTPGPNDPLCCGTVENHVTLRYNGSLKLIRKSH